MSKDPIVNLLSIESVPGSILRTLNKFYEFVESADGYQTHIICHVQGFIRGFTSTAKSVSLKASETVVEQVTQEKISSPQASDCLTTIVSEPISVPMSDVQSNTSSDVLPKKKKKSATPVSSIIGEPIPLPPPTEARKISDNVEKSSYGYKSRAEFARAYRKVSTRVHNECLSRIGNILYPSICKNAECTLCISWYLCTAISPCHPKHCDGKCKFGYSPHTSPYGLKLLKKYHTRILAFPIHVNPDAPDGPEFENPLCTTPELPIYYPKYSDRIQVIINLSSNTNVLATMMRKNNQEDSGKPDSSSDESDGSFRPYIIPKGKRSRKGTVLVDHYQTRQLDSI